MSKAILVMDMPENCSKCPCFFGTYTDMICCANDRTIDYPYPNNFRQNWCPLKTMPEKQNLDLQTCSALSFTEEQMIMAEGWNAYIDTIMGELDEKQIDG